MSHFQPDLQDRKRDWDMVLRAFDTVMSSRCTTRSFTFAGSRGRILNRTCRPRSSWRARGFDLAKDVDLILQAFVASMPCTLSPALQKAFRSCSGCVVGRQRDNAVMTSPLIAEWKGNRHSVMTLFGRWC